MWEGAVSQESAVVREGADVIEPVEEACTEDCERRCSIPGCQGIAAYAARLGVPWPRLPVIYCAECTHGIAKWIIAHWKGARMEVVPL